MKPLWASQTVAVRLVSKSISDQNSEKIGGRHTIGAALSCGIRNQSGARHVEKGCAILSTMREKRGGTRGSLGSTER